MCDFSLSQEEIDQLLGAAPLKTDPTEGGTSVRQQNGIKWGSVTDLVEISLPYLSMRRHIDCAALELKLKIESNPNFCSGNITGFELVATDYVVSDSIISLRDSQAYILPFKYNGGHGFFELPLDSVRMFSKLINFFDHSSIKGSTAKQLFLRTSDVFRAFAKDFFSTIIEHIYPDLAVTLLNPVCDTRQIPIPRNEKIINLKFETKFTGASFASIEECISDIFGQCNHEESKIAEVFFPGREHNTYLNLLSGMNQISKEVTEKNLKWTSSEVGQMLFNVLTQSGCGTSLDEMTNMMSDLTHNIERNLNDSNKPHECIINLAIEPDALFRESYQKSIVSDKDKTCLGSIPLCLEVELGRINYPLSKILVLGCGEIIDLNKVGLDELDVYVNTVYIGKCRLKNDGGKYQITMSDFRPKEVVPSGGGYEKLDSGISLRAIIGHTYIALRELLDISVGSTFRLDEDVGVSPDVILICNNEPLFKGTIVSGLTDEYLKNIAVGVRIREDIKGYFCQQNTKPAEAPLSEK